VLDLGGYEGQWTSDIYSRYTCPVYVFEPVKEYFELIRYRFENNSKIRCFQLGLSNSTYQTEITINEFASSTYNQTKQGKKETIQIKSFIEFTVEKQITHVDLMKINIEGGEYDLLDSVIANGWIKNINQLLIQFHQFVENADERRNRIREKLKETHTEVFNYEYVWEYWKLKS
jgi:FkbM family methyltransferase